MAATTDRSRGNARLRSTPPPGNVLARVTALGNAGFRLACPSVTFFLDPFVPGVSARNLPTPGDTGPTSVILVTHDHWDHLNVRAVLEAVAQGAVVIGPEPVIRILRRQASPERLLPLEPDEIGTQVSIDVLGARITAFRTSHGSAHNSYRVEVGAFRFFDDGDNESTSRLCSADLRGLDALFLCPWQGSGWAHFIEAIRPRYWFLIHLTDEEIRTHERGRFLPELSDHIPMEALALRPGASYDIAERKEME